MGRGRPDGAGGAARRPPKDRTCTLGGHSLWPAVGTRCAPPDAAQVGQRALGSPPRSRPGGQPGVEATATGALCRRVQLSGRFLRSSHLRGFCEAVSELNSL